MSNPQNPLNEFRSYSYYHVLCLCDSTQSALELSRSTDLMDYQNDKPLTQYDPSEIVPKVNKRGQYFVLINGSTDTKLNIQSAKWSTIFFPKTTGSGEKGVQLRTQMVDGEMIIHEIFGVDFLNYIDQALRKFGIDPNSGIYVLKTVFVGHKDDGTTHIVKNIKPLSFILYDIQAKFDITGAYYTLSMVGVSCGAAQSPHIQAISEHTRVSGIIGKSPKEAIEIDLADKINSVATEKWNKIRSCYNAGVDIEDEFIKVEYFFHVDEIYGTDLKVGTATIASKGDVTSKDPIFSARRGRIENIINQIMLSCKEIENKDKISENEKYFFTITSKINTYKEDGERKYEVHFYVNQKSSPVKPKEWLLTGPKLGEGKLELDYIFTGKNIDIIDFDITMQQGLGFFQMLTSMPSVPLTPHKTITGNSASAETQQTGQKQGSGTQEIRVRKPFFVGTNVKIPTHLTSKNFIGVTSYESLLSRHAALEDLEATVKIHGNPQLLNDTTFNIDDATLGDMEKTIADIDSNENVIAPNTHKLPLYVKINIRMPTNPASKSDEQIVYNDPTRSFWYNSWYYILGIDHQFERGEFTQTIDAMSIPIQDGPVIKGGEYCPDPPDSDANTKSEEK